METLIVEARENILSDEYGKLDLVESLFPLEILLSQKPKQIRKLICAKLSVLPEQIDYECLRSWLRRLRKKHSNKQITKTKTKASYVKGDWRNFQPSEPVSSLKADGDILKKVTHSE